MSIFYDLVYEDELEDAHNIEVQGYPEDEAASLETFRYRQAQAPELFLGAYLPGLGETRRELIGYVCATLSPDTTLTHASMATHVPGAPSVCIHSVCVSPAHRRRGVGITLLREYTTRLSASTAVELDNDNDNQNGDEKKEQKQDNYERVLLITHEELRAFYERAGFEWAGASEVVHGARPWFEMRKVLPPLGPSPPLTQSPDRQQVPPEQAAGGGAGGAAPDIAGLPPSLWEALQRASSSSSSGTPARLLASFPNAVQDVIDTVSDASGSPTNKFALLCPRPGCGSVVLSAGVGRWVERASVQLDLAPPAGQERAVPEYMGALPAPPATAQWWLVTPNAMAFENVGFSRPVQGLTGPSGRKMKFLACAECDVGPLGWCEEGGSEFWLACNRVGYRA